MMPLSHVYVSTQVTGRSNPLLIFGSVLPDISFAPNSLIPRNELHDNPDKFMLFVEKGYPQLKDLAIGVNLHSGINKGADYYSDDREVGFAFNDGHQIVSEVAKILDVEADEGALVLSHNFLEAGVDINLAKTHSEIERVYFNGLSKLDLQLVANCLGEYLNIDQEKIFRLLNHFIPFAKSVGTADKMTGIFIPLIKARYNKEVPKGKVAALIDKAVELTFGKNYLDEAISKMRKDFVEI
jgi:hypothetical protein